MDNRFSRALIWKQFKEVFYGRPLKRPSLDNRFPRALIWKQLNEVFYGSWNRYKIQNRYSIYINDQIEVFCVEKNAKKSAMDRTHS